MPPTRRLPRTDVLLVALHWLLFIAVAVSLLTGLRVSHDWDDHGPSHYVEPLLLQGDVTLFHMWAAMALILVAAAYAAFLVRAQLTARVRFDGRRVRALSSPDPRQRWMAVNVLIYWFAFLLFAVLAATGVLIYAGAHLIAYEAITAVHRAAAWGLVAYLVAHVAGQIAFGGARHLLKVLNPRLGELTVAVTALTAGLGAVGAVYAFDHATTRSLVLARVAPGEAPVLDGRPDDAAWAKAVPVTIHTVRGEHQPGGEVPVTVRALHDGKTAYFLFDWPDATRSQKHLPLMKTDAGWKLLENGFDHSDERSYYEDKLAIMVAPTASIQAGGTAHLGPRPLPGKPKAPNGRGLHMTEDGTVVDMWYWKSVRAGASGTLDDDHFGPPAEPKDTDWTGETRYTGGYQVDPKTGGGFLVAMKRREGSMVVPTHLPKSPEVLKVMGRIDPDPDGHDEGQWWLPVEDTVPYSPEHDALFPVGTVIPSVVVLGPYEGDRGDVRGAGRWENGRWRLEVARRLDTGSKYDQPIATGKYLSVATFDHTQARHSQHLHPVMLKLGE